MKLGLEIDARIAAINEKAATDIASIQARAASDVAILTQYKNASPASILNLETDVFKSAADTLINILRAK